MRDVKYLLRDAEPDSDVDLDDDRVQLWDGDRGAVDAGVSYNDDPGGLDDFDDYADIDSLTDDVPR